MARKKKLPKDWYLTILNKEIESAEEAKKLGNDILDVDFCAHINAIRKLMLKRDSEFAEFGCHMIIENYFAKMEESND